jgi:hypothetical protein
MAAPKFSPSSPVEDARGYQSPPHVPDTWRPTRPAEIHGFQPEGARMGYQGPDQGFAIKLANSIKGRIHVRPHESDSDAVRGCLAIALRRASMFSRAPVIHDLTIAFTAWGFFDENPPAELLAMRRRLFEGVGNVVHHYDEGRILADSFPEATLRMSPEQVASAYPAKWRDLVGADAHDA